MKNIAQINEISKENKPPAIAFSNERLVLDDYVACAGSKMLYARLPDSKDLAVIACDKKPTSGDMVLCKFGEKFSIENFSDVLPLIRPLHLVARNGKPVQEMQGSFEVVGTVTHFVRTVAEVLR